MLTKPFSRFKKKSLSLLCLFYPEECNKMLDEIYYKKLAQYYLKINLKSCLEDNLENIIYSGISTITCIAKLNQTVIVTANYNSSDIILWDLNEKCCVKTINSSHRGKIVCLTKLSGNQLASGCTKGTIILWDLNTGHNICNYISKYYEILVTCKVNNRLFLAGSNSFIKLWDYSSGPNNPQNIKHIETPCIVKIGPSKLVSGDSKGSIYIVTIIDSLKFSMKEYFHEVHQGRVESLIKINKDQIASGGSDFVIKILDLTNGLCIQTLKGHLGIIKSLVKISKDRIASGSLDQSIKIWNLSNGSCIRSMNSHHMVNFLLLFGQTKILYDEDTQVKVWDL